MVQFELPVNQKEWPLTRSINDKMVVCSCCAWPICLASHVTQNVHNVMREIVAVVCRKPLFNFINEHLNGLLECPCCGVIFNFQNDLPLEAAEFQEEAVIILRPGSIREMYYQDARTHFNFVNQV